MWKLTMILITLLTLTLFAACERSVGSDPMLDAGTNNNNNVQPDAFVPEPATLEYDVAHWVNPMRLSEPLGPITLIDLINDSNEDIMVSSITFTLKGTISPNEVLELWLYHELPFEFHSDTYTWDGDRVTFDLSDSPIYIERGNMHSFTLRILLDADPCEDTIGFDIDRDQDISAVGLIYDLNANIVESIYSESANPIPVHGESVTFAPAADNPQPADVFVGTFDHPFMIANLSTLLDVDVDEVMVRINLPTAYAANHFSHLTLWMKDAQDQWMVVGGPVDLVPGMCPNGTCDILLEDVFSVDACVTESIMITMDISSGAYLGTRVSVDLIIDDTTVYDSYNGIPLLAEQVSGGDTLYGSVQEVIQ